MDTPDENASKNASRRPQSKHLRPKPFKPGPADEVGRPRGGRPLGSVSLSAAYRAALAELDPTDKAGRRTCAQAIARTIAQNAIDGAIDAAREIRVATEGDSLRIDGAIEVVYVNDWRNATADSAEATSWDPSSAWGSEKVQLGAVRAPLAENHNGNGSHR